MNPSRKMASVRLVIAPTREHLARGPCRPPALHHRGRRAVAGAPEVLLMLRPLAAPPETPARLRAAAPVAASARRRAGGAGRAVQRSTSSSSAREAQAQAQAGRRAVRGRAGTPPPFRDTRRLENAKAVGAPRRWGRRGTGFGPGGRQKTKKGKKAGPGKGSRGRGPLFEQNDEPPDVWAIPHPPSSSSISFFGVFEFSRPQAALQGPSGNTCGHMLHDVKCTRLLTCQMRLGDGATKQAPALPPLPCLTSGSARGGTTRLVASFSWESRLQDRRSRRFSDVSGRVSGFGWLWGGFPRGSVEDVAFPRGSGGPPTSDPLALPG